MSTASSSRFAILLDGDLTPTERLRRQLSGCRVLAADGGIRHAAKLGLTPELWLGDFDSADSPLAKRFADVPCEAWPGDKPVSDGQIAIRHALDADASEIVLAGALGGERSDHAFFNLAGAAELAAARPDVAITLTSGREEAIPLLPGRPLRQDWPEHTLFSVLGFTALTELTVRSAKWPLDCVHVPFGSTWTLSNVAGEELEILLGDGCGIAICQFE
jgi:thiamine pyrophosphokinase